MTEIDFIRDLIFKNGIMAWSLKEYAKDQRILKNM